MDRELIKRKVAAALAGLGIDFGTTSREWADVERLETENRQLRQILWLRHGCEISALYGDDGEMQCSRCRLDFKRDSAEAIERRFMQLTLMANGMTQAELADALRAKLEGKDQ